MGIATRIEHSRPSQRTTLPIRIEHLQQIDRLVRAGSFASRAAFVTHALERYFWDLEEAEMFAAFEGAANDPEWVQEAVALAEEAVPSGWEVIELGELAETES